MNYEFKSEMASDMNGLIEIKVATHHCESTYLDRAKSFDSFCAEHYPDADLVIQSIVLEWIKDALDSHTRNVAYTRVAFIRALAEYQKAIGKDPFIPPSGMLNGKTIFVPYIFTDDELEKFFHEADCNKSGTVFEQMKFCTYFRLTYTCGLRPQESRTLKRINVDLNSGEIRIVNSKWNRSRTVIMSDEMLTLARKYATKRDIKFPESEYFFPTNSGGLHTAAHMAYRFKKFYAASHPDIPKQLLSAVRVYDLRHRFATAVLNKWLDEKIDINARLPYLQAYMGHKNISSTAYYIHLLPENLTKSAGVDWKHLNAMIPEVEPWEE